MSALDDLRKKLKLESNEYYNKLSKELEMKNAKKRGEVKKYNNQYQQERQQLSNYGKTMSQEQKQLGIKTTNELVQKHWQAKTELPVKTLNDIIKSPSSNDYDYFLNNQKKINDYNNTSETKKQYDILRNKNEYTRYMRDLAEVNFKETTFADKINMINQYTAGLEGAMASKNYYDENGNYISLPSKNQLKAQKSYQDSGFLLNAGQSAFQSLGAMTPAMIASVTGIPGLSEAVTFATTLNSAQNEKLLEGYSKEEARNYGLINAGLETFLGTVLGGTSRIITGKESILSNSIGKLTNKLFKNRGLSYFMAHLTSEEIEENLQTVLDPINEHITLGKYDSLTDALSSITGEDIALTALSTLITIGMTEGPEAITKSRIDKINKQYDTDIKLKSNENSLAEVVLNNQTKNREEIEEVNNNVKHENVDETVKNETINDTIKNNTTNTINNIQQQVEEIAVGLSNNTITNSVAQEQLVELQNGLTVLQQYNSQQSNNDTNEVLDRQSQEISILSSQISEIQQAMGVNQTPQLQQIEDKTAFSMPVNNIEKGNTYTSKVNNQEVEFNVLDVANDKALIEITKSTLPTQQVGSKVTTSLNSPLIQNVVQPIDYINNVKYTPEIQKKINELVSTANTYLNKTQKANDIVKLLQKIIVNKGYFIRFNPDITNEQGIAVNGLIRKENGTTTIELNPNANNYVEFLIVHEITHDIATEEMKELILDYAKQDPEFEKSLESLKERYKTNDVSDEVVADVCGELFGNREFIQSVVEKKPNIFKKILNNIRKLAEKIKGTGANEYVSFVEKLKTMWEDAYYSNRSNLKDKMFSIQQDSNGNKYVEVDTDQDIFEGVDEKDYNKIAKMYITDYLMGNTTLATDSNAIIDSRSARKYTNPGDRQRYFTEKMKLSPELKNVLAISEKISESLPTKESTKYSKWEYYKINFKINDQIFTGKVNIGVDTGGRKHFYEVNNIKKASGISGISPNYPTGFSANNIPQSNSNVNSDTSSTTKYSIPTNKNNTQELDNSSFSYDYQSLRPKVRGGWTIEKIQKQLKAESSGRLNSKELEKFDNLDDLMNNIYYHGSISSHDNLKAGSTLNENQRTGGYGEAYHTISLSKSKNIASNFASIGSQGTVMPVILKKGAKVVEMTNIEDSIELEDILPELWNQKIDAVKIGDWDIETKGYGEQEIVILNPRAIMTLPEGTTYFQNYHKPKFENMTKEEVRDTLNKRLKKLLDDPKTTAENKEQIVKRFDKILNNNFKKVNNILPTKYSQNTKEWNEYLKENFPSSGTKTKMSEIKAPIREDIESSSKKSKILNPNEISKLTKEDVNTTPLLPKRENINRYNNGDSKFAKNIKEKVNMLSVDQKAEILSKEDVRYYDKVTNKESLEKAFKKINDGGRSETLRWVKQDSKNANATDVAEGWILLKQYADNGDYDSMVEVARKMREIGTTAGQTVQAFNIMERMTPEGMVKYAQTELTEAYDKMVKNKSREWIEKYREDFDLKPDEVKFIMDTMKEIQNMEDGYDKRVKLAEIQKLMTDKLPPEKGAKIKSWMRMSMLFNPKTQVRNVAGNALIMPVNSFGDLFSSYVDKLISKKTGIRTTGNTNIKAMLNGIKKGAYEATNDYKKGINTKDMDGNRFEISNGKSFSEKNLMGKALNRTESLLNYVMDIGDRIFSEAAFENSLQNQMVLNNTNEITQEMIDIAHQEALSRTWNDNNNYTRFVLNARTGLNKLANFKGYGLGDVLIPFAKTPANLTKAIVDYSPAGLIGAINKGVNLKKSLTNGQYTATMQHDFVQSLGKAAAGTMLYVLGIALAKAGISSGDSDDDKDTANFLKNTLGVSSYSIKIGDKSFAYDWAQPIAAPLSITANIVNKRYQNKDSKELLSLIIDSLDTGGSILLEQSFLQSINDVLTDNNGIASGIIKEVLELPARAVPTFSKQIADLIDGTQRTTFEYGNPLKSASNSIVSKIPILSKTLSPSADTMGREIEKYGGKNNLFNVFLNPANVNTENISKSAGEIYRLYKSTGERDIMPRVSPYYINQKGEKIILSSKERTEYQKVSGKIIETSVDKLLSNKNYTNLSDKEKAEVVNNIVNYSYNIAKKEVLNLDLSNEYQKANMYSKVIDIGDYYVLKTQKFTSDKDSNGKTIKNSKKNKEIKFVNSLKLSIPQKAILIKMNYSSFDNYDNEIKKYINTKALTDQERQEIFKDLNL